MRNAGRRAKDPRHPAPERKAVLYSSNVTSTAIRTSWQASADTVEYNTSISTCQVVNPAVVHYHVNQVRQLALGQLKVAAVLQVRSFHQHVHVSDLTESYVVVFYLNPCVVHTSLLNRSTNSPHQSCADTCAHSLVYVSSPQLHTVGGFLRHSSGLSGCTSVIRL